MDKMKIRNCENRYECGSYLEREGILLPGSVLRPPTALAT